MATRKNTARRNAARRPAPRGKRATRRPAPAWRGHLPSGWLGLPKLSQGQRDLLGLGLVAVGVLLAFVLWLGGDGGRVGEALAEGLAWLLGVVRHLVPVALIGGGAVLVLRPVLPAVRPFRAGGLCLFAALTLALAAGTLGLGPDGARDGFWHRDFFETRGGAVGEALYWAASSLFQRVGAHILALFLLAAGVLLLTGATIAGVVVTTRRGVSHGTQRLRHSTQELTGLVRRGRPEPAAPPLPPFERTVEPPEPEPERLVVRATHVEALPPELRDEPVSVEEDPEAEGAVAVTDPPEPPEAADEDGDADAQRLTPQGRYRASVTDDPDFAWQVPDAAFLTRSTAEQGRPDTAGQERVATQLVEALGHFGIEAKVTGKVTGPHITRYELRLAPGIKVAKVAQLKDDLAYALAATEIRILAPIPGKQAVGVEVPNARRKMVHLGDVFQDPPPDWSPLTVWLGKDVSGRAIGADLTKMPHVLVAGTTGSGKSGCVNAMLTSILLRATPHEVRLVLVDPKQVELNHYESIPHLLTPVITSPRMAANALQNLVREMDDRYGHMSLARTRNLEELNRARERRGDARLPYILCVIDELADLMMVAPADVEDSIIRLAQKARAVGIHLVLATQSPRVDVITGMIKANVPSRIAFAVSSQTDSRVILDQNGAESLLGQGDMLFSPIGSSRLQRIQGAYVDEDQIAKLTEGWRRQGEPEFREELLEEVVDDTVSPEGDEDFDPDEDPLLEEAIALVAQMQTASTSMLQRRLRLGYTRAGRLIDMLERRGVISGYEGSKPRQVLIGEGDVPRVMAQLSGAPEAGAPDAVLADGE